MGDKTINGEQTAIITHSVHRSLFMVYC